MSRPVPSSSESTTPSPREASWRGFLHAASLVGLGLLVLLYGLILVLDPYGRRAGPGRPPSPIMDINQRYMYPQLARSRQFDSAVFGTSTARLLDPILLDRKLGGRFANLAINAGTPWEQLQLATLFLRHVPAPKTIVLGFDRPWCDPRAGEPDQRVTFRSFPPWLYDESALDDLPHLLNLKTLEIAGRLALHRLGWMPARIRGDGYEVFTPPEATYDLARARLHLAAGASEGARAPHPPATGPLPTAAWLSDFARMLPATTRLVALFPPVHAEAQPVAGSAAEVADEACKAAIVEALGPARTLTLDYRMRSALAIEDTNFWDSLHYRLPIAGRIVDDIVEAGEGASAPADGRYRLLSRPAKP